MFARPLAPISLNVLNKDPASSLFGKQSSFTDLSSALPTPGKARQE